MINFMCQFGYTLVSVDSSNTFLILFWRYFLDVIKLKSVDIEQSKLPSKRQVSLVHSVKDLRAKIKVSEARSN